MEEADLPGSTPSFQKRNVHVSSTIPKEGRLGHWGQGTIGTLGPALRHIACKENRVEKRTYAYLYQ
jgi:hypothetical protein